MPRVLGHPEDSSENLDSQEILAAPFCWANQIGVMKNMKNNTLTSNTRTNNRPSSRNYWLECAKRGLSEELLVKSALQQLSVNPSDSDCHRIITQAISSHDTRELLHSEPFRRTNPTGNAVNGTIRLGVVRYTGAAWGLPPKALTNHLGIFGRTGGGKSEIIKSIIKSLRKNQRCKVITFDRKQDFFDSAFDDEFLYFLLKDFRDNWLAPPNGVEDRLWFNIVGEILSTAFELRIAAQGLFVDTLIELNTVFKKAGAGYPTLNAVSGQLLLLSKQFRGPSREVSLRLRQRIVASTAILGNAAAAQHCADWQKLTKFNWALSLAGLASSTQSLCITIYFAKTLLYRICNNLRSDELETLIILDEASVIFPRDASKKTSLLLDYFQQARAFGIGVIFASQSMNLSDEVFANTGTKISVGGFGHGSDYESFGSAVGLNRAQRDFMRTISRPGSAVVKDLRHGHPFTVQIDRPE
jgi:ABC-type dipeptide/oligopeptide/nickel transport system ATPase component